MRKQSWPRVLFIVFIALLLLLSQSTLVYASLPTVLHEQVQTETVAQGVTYERHLRFDSGGWLSYHVTRIDMTSSSIRVDQVLAGDKVSTPAPLSQTAASQGAIAALNGDFFFIGETGSPLGPVIKNGELISTPSYNPDLAALGISKQGIAQIGYWSWKASITLPGGKNMAVDGLNKQGASFAFPIVYDPSWGRPTPGTPKVGSGHLELVVKGGKVTEVRRDQPGIAVPAEGYVVVGRDAAATFLAQAKVGDAVKLDYTINPDWHTLRTAIGGGSMLVKDGKVAQFTHEIGGRNPRSAVGTSRDGKTLWLVAVDGRVATSRGATQTELAELLIELGAYQALNLDGGGSTTMVTRTLEQPVAVRNQPSDGSERRVPNGLAVFLTAPKGALTGLRLTPDQDVMVAGTNAALKLIGYDANFTPVDLKAGTVSWSVSPATVGQVIDGRFVAKDPGVAQITARIGAITTASTVRVIKPSQIVAEPHALSSAPGVRQPIAIRATDADGWSSLVPIESVKWTLSPDVGAISDGAFVAAGTSVTKATIKAEWAGLSHEIPILGMQELVLDEFNDNNVKRDFTFYPQGIMGSIRLAAANEPRYNGNSGKLSYYFPKQPNTRAAYLSYGENGLALPTGAQTLKLWVNGKMATGQWLRMQLTDAAGNKQVLDLDKNVNWSDWRQLSASIPSDWPQPLRLDRIYVAETDQGKMVMGAIFLDRLTVLAPETPPPASAWQDPRATSFNTSGTKIGITGNVSLPATSQLPWQSSVQSLISRLGLGQPSQTVVTGGLAGGATVAMPSTNQTISLINGYREIKAGTTSILTLDTPGGLGTASPNQWKWFAEQLKVKRTQPLLVAFSSPLGAWKDPLEAELVQSILSTWAKENQQTVWIFAPGDETRAAVKDGVRTLTIGKQDLLMLSINGQEISYIVKALPTK